MKKKILVDVSTDEKRKEVFRCLDGFKSKNQAHIYFGISDNAQGAEYLETIANIVGFNLDEYKLRRQKPVKYCKQCGNIITSKWGKDFCCRSCAATYNNKQRDETVYKKVSEKLKKDNSPKTEKIKPIKKNVFEKQCEVCGKIFTTKNKNARFCCNKCSALNAHLNAYNDFLQNNEKYCRGNYTPKGFKQEFLNEQDNKCAICGCKNEHNGKPLTFVLDHIDGDASNNKRENLRLICPNCDSQLETFKSKNKNSKRRNYWKEHIIETLSSSTVEK